MEVLAIMPVSAILQQRDKSDERRALIDHPPNRDALWNRIVKQERKRLERFRKLHDYSNKSFIKALGLWTKHRGFWVDANGYGSLLAFAYYFADCKVPRIARNPERTGQITKLHAYADSLVALHRWAHPAPNDPPILGQSQSNRDQLIDVYILQIQNIATDRRVVFLPEFEIKNSGTGQPDDDYQLVKADRTVLNSHHGKLARPGYGTPHINLTNLERIVPQHSIAGLAGVEQEFLQQTGLPNLPRYFAYCAWDAQTHADAQALATAAHNNPNIVVPRPDWFLAKLLQNIYIY